MAFKWATSVIVATLTLGVAASDEDSESSFEKIEQICQSSGSRVGLESSALESMVSQCTSSLSGRTFDTDEPMTDEDVYTIEEQCAEESQSGGDEAFEKAFEQCASREVISLLQRVSV